MTATLPVHSPLGAHPDLDPQAMLRVWEAMVRGARAYVERHELGGIDAEHLGDVDEQVTHVSGIVQAASRQVVANCSDELELVGRDPDALRNVRFARITREAAIDLLAVDYPGLSADDDLRAEHVATLVARIGPCFVTRGPQLAVLLLPWGGVSADPTIDLTRLARFIVGNADVTAPIARHAERAQAT